LRRHSTGAEEKVWYWLRRRYLGGHKFRRQHSLDRYVLDFYCPALKLCIEIDGTSHDTHKRERSDAERTAFLASRGITVVRLRNEHIVEQPYGAWSLIVDAVERAKARSS
jgi:very-short-patch-repair endonuclease